MQQATPSVKELFFAALELESSEARSAFLDRHCGDTELRRQVEELLAVDAQGGDFLESPASMPTVTAAHESHLAIEEAGTVIGPYKLLEAVGEGGMGTVYMAEQTEPVRRRVALKLIKPGMDSKQVVARFEAERQALAMMDHPNIAKVHDAGMTPSGRPFFVMELVRGLPITEYCDREEFSIAERLELFVLVCRAVQHAHQKGVIHRDLKPSNVLVTVVDGVPTPKVIDFGVAKATGQSLTDKTLFTGFHQFVGTPLYTSPEQAELSGADVDTRSDIYSLGVLLYELLTGTTPFDSETLKKAAFDEMRRIIREEEPPRPSTRLSTLGEQLSTVSAQRKVDPRRLGASMKGELDWVVMKALEKDRRRRYETANDFAADVMRYLTDRPVEAYPPSSWYRFRKYTRRNRVALSTGAVVVVAVVAGLVASIWQAARATRAEVTASQRASESEAVLRFLVEDLLGASQPERSARTDVRMADVLADAERRIDAAFQGQPRLEASVRQALAIIFESMGRYDDGRRNVTRAFELRRDILGHEHPDTLRAANTLADLLALVGERDRARELMEQTIETWRRIRGLENPETLTSMATLARVLNSADDFVAAQELMERTLEARRRVLGLEHRDTLRSASELAEVLARQSKWTPARGLIEPTLAAQRRVLGPEHPDTLSSTWVMAFVIEMQGHYGEARRLVEQEFAASRRLRGPEHPKTLAAMKLLTRILLKDPAATAQDHKRALELARKVSALGSRDRFHWKWLAIAEYRAGEWDAAIRANERCIELQGNDGYAFMWTVMATAHARRGNMDQARRWWAKVKPTLDREAIADTPRWLIAEAIELLDETGSAKKGAPVPVPRSKAPPE
jgi:serine/threonine protein kinase/tetratricopeptide (TPR) repeat protein